MTQEEREAWTAAYRAYERYADAIKAAAAAKDGDTVARLFNAASDDLGAADFAQKPVTVQQILLGAMFTLDGLYMRYKSV